MPCECPVPLLASDPRRKACLRCSMPIEGGVGISSDEAFAEFFDRLQRAMFPGKVPEWFVAFRRECEARERQGREEYGLSYLRRDNCVEACQEFADGAIYFMFDVLQSLRNTGDEEGIDIALTGAWHAAEAHRCAQELSARRRAS